MNTENINPIETKINLPEEETMYAGMNEVFEHTRKIFEPMQQGERIGIKDLVDKVTSQVELSSGNVMGLVQLWCKKSKEVTVEVGRGGGVFKGGKPKRIDHRPRCGTCHQVVRSETKRPNETDEIESDHLHDLS